MCVGDAFYQNIIRSTLPVSSYYSLAACTAIKATACSFSSLPSLPLPMPTILNGGMAASLRLEDSQLAELSAQAKKAPNFQGYLSKLDTGSKSSKKASASKKWCILHRNFLFYYDIETSSRPTGVLLVESCTVGSVAVVDTLLPDCFPQDREVTDYTVHVYVYSYRFYSIFSLLSQPSSLLGLPCII